MSPRSRRSPAAFNAEVARQFREAADLLEDQDADPFRVAAYRRAAAEIEKMEGSLADVYIHKGVEGLIAIPTIGSALALAIADLVETGRWRWLDRLEGQADPEAVLATVAGVGPELARRIHRELGVETLEELELAASDGTLADLRGFGPKRVRSIADSLAGRLRRSSRPARASRRSTPRRSSARPSVPELLDIDNQYRFEAAAGRLPTVAPRRFNPAGSSWLPVLHTAREDRHYTVMFSNTARAHELGRTHDWVVIYADGPDDGQWTVVTETRGPRAGLRVVRGREAETPPTDGSD